VIDPFVREYQAGRTPNPCILCNEHLKFRALLRKADELGAEGVATGHYAVIRREPDGRCRLFASPDAGKDQSYFLYSLDSDRLRRIRFPVGEMTKEQVRKIALEAGLPVYEKRESQDICFVTDDSYTRFLESRGISEDRGRFVDREGTSWATTRGSCATRSASARGSGSHRRSPSTSWRSTRRGTRSSSAATGRHFPGRRR